MGTFTANELVEATDAPRLCARPEPTIERFSDSTTDTSGAATAFQRSCYGGTRPGCFTDGARPTCVRLLSALSRVRERADVSRTLRRAEATVDDEDVVRLALRTLACAERPFGIQMRRVSADTIQFSKRFLCSCRSFFVVGRFSAAALSHP